MVNVAGAVRSAAYVLPPGEVGEVYITGPTFMKGYWNGPDATAQSPCSPPAPR
ncbi:AMP-binding protein [Nonomuraea lactucae]|uniref:AMP-binding protein n=1 Tax=Nonomuraea lactucae TaxID=2249762 RepID=UPI001966377F|nr:AMP-binding protein [Nonomuraea lactucae]